MSDEPEPFEGLIAGAVRTEMGWRSKEVATGTADAGPTGLWRYLKPQRATPVPHGCNVPDDNDVAAVARAGSIWQCRECGAFWVVCTLDSQESLCRVGKRKQQRLTERYGPIETDDRPEWLPQ